MDRRPRERNGPDGGRFEYLFGTRIHPAGLHAHVTDGVQMTPGVDSWTESLLSLGTVLFATYKKKMSLPGEWKGATRGGTDRFHRHLETVPI